MCLWPIHLNRDGVEQVVPCGHCAACLERKRDEWTIRLKEELRHSTNAQFVGLSYSDENLPHDEDGLMTLDKKDFQDFMKRFRSYLPKSETGKIKYFAVGEYSPAPEYRPHFHVILFNTPLGIDTLLLLKQAWQKGFVENTPLNERRCAYTAMYSLANFILDERYKEADKALYFARRAYQKDPINNPPPDKEKIYFGLPRKPFAMISKGLGISYVNSSAIRNYHLSDVQHHWYHTDESGIKRPLPRYYALKLFDDEQRAEHFRLTQEKPNPLDKMTHFERIQFFDAYTLQVKHRVEKTKKHY